MDAGKSPYRHLTSDIRPLPFERELPEHAILFLIEQLSSFDNAPESHVLPTPDGELVKERHAMSAFDGGQ